MKHWDGFFTHCTPAKYFIKSKIRGMLCMPRESWNSILAHMADVINQFWPIRCHKLDQELDTEHRALPRTNVSQKQENTRWIVTFHQWCSWTPTWYSAKVELPGFGAEEGLGWEWLPVTGRGYRRRAWGPYATQRGRRWLSSSRLFPSRFGSVSAHCYRCVDCFCDS